MAPHLSLSLSPAPPTLPPLHHPPTHTTGLAREADAEAALTAELDAARAEAAALPPQLERLSAAVAAAEAALADRVAGSDASLAESQARVSAMRRSLALYEEATGVRFITPAAEGGVDGEIGIEFRHLDPSAPAAIARLGVRVDAAGLYAVTRCDPPARRVGMLARDLAARRLEFGAFVRAARAEFKAVLAGGRR